MRHYVYVLDKDGNPLDPTTRYGWVRRALSSGKAVPVTTVPFTIKLTYEPETKITHPVRVAVDPGRTNIGISAVREDDGKCLFRAKCETRNKEIVKLMFNRARHRRSSRTGERKARKRLAKRLGTTMKQILKRKLPGYGDGCVTVKDIINTEARFNNRFREEGWLTPTARQLLQTHESLVKKVCKILPVKTMALEYNKFDFVRMENADVTPYEYGKGPLHGYKGNLMKALYALQDGRCLACGKEEVVHKHHINPVSHGGSNTLGNLAGLCHECHEKVHIIPDFADKIMQKKEGFNKKHAGASVVNQIMDRFTKWCVDTFDQVYIIQGSDTKRFREDNHLTKDHDIDAYCIATTTLGKMADPDMPPCYEVKQYRHHDRANINAQIYRSYYLDGKKVAQNRRPAMSAELANNGKIRQRSQKFPALSDWYEEMAKEKGELEAQRLRTKLTVKKSIRRYNNPDRVMPGSIFYYEGKRYVLKGQLTNGKYYTAEDMPESFRVPASKCKVFNNRGLVFVA